MLGPDGTHVLKSFQVRPNMGPWAFAKETATAMRYSAEDAAKFRAALPPAKSEEYQGLVSALKRAEEELSVWLRGAPPTTDENRDIFAGFGERIDKITAGVEAVELEKCLRDVAGKEAENAGQLLRRAESEVKLLVELEMARRDLSDWLLSRPAGTEKDRAVLQTLTQRVAAVQAKLAGARE
jgi:hypothetical protein